MKKLFVVLLIISLVFTLAFSVCAESEAYTYNFWGEVVSAPCGYAASESVFGSDIGIGTFSQPKDLFVDKNGYIYISDTGNHRVVSLNPDYTVRWIWDSVTDGSDSVKLTSPAGLYVDDNENIYICLTEQAVVIKCDSSGNVLAKFESPKSPLLTKDFVFEPSRIVVSESGTVFVLIEGFYLGAIVYNSDGEFLTFYGSNDVKITAKMVSDKFLRKFMTEEQKNKLSRYVPVQYDGFDIDSSGFIYTCTKGADSQEIRKMNTLSNNVLQYQGNMGDLQSTYIMGKVEDTQFIDLCVHTGGFISALDSNRGRVFQYDREGELMMIFGGSGDGLGLFASPCAIDEWQDRIYVLDNELGNITVFKTTEYGQLLREGISLYQDGLYEKAEKIWRTVLQMDVNSELAYNGLGKALMSDEKYTEAMDCFKKANNRDGYSECFKSYRSLAIKKYFPIAISAVLILAVAIAVWEILRKKRHSVQKKVSKLGSLRSVLRLLSHPTDETGEIKYADAWNVGLATAVLVLFFMSAVANNRLTAFIFNTNNPNKFNVLVQIAITIGAFLLFVCINWAVTTLLAGKGKIKEIYCAASYALLPYIFTTFISVVCSHFMIADEKAFLVLLQIFGLLWSAFVLISVLRVIHEYSFKKVFASLFLTALGMAFVVFILMLFVSLVEQLISFIKSIYNEAMYRR